MSKTTTASVCGQINPTIFLSFDGTLHRGRGILQAGVVQLDSGREVFEFAPILAHLLTPYPNVDIVLITRWLQQITLDEAIFCLPADLAWRVTGAAPNSCSNLSHPHNSPVWREMIYSYAYSRCLNSWLILGDENPYVNGYQYRYAADRFLPLAPELGICDIKACEYIKRWLRQVHNERLQ